MAIGMETSLQLNINLPLIATIDHQKFRMETLPSVNCVETVTLLPSLAFKMFIKMLSEPQLLGCPWQQRTTTNE